MKSPLWIKKISEAILYFSIGIIIILTSTTGFILFTMNKNTEQTADVIIVLGKEVNPCLQARVQHAVDLYKNKKAPLILMTGGTDTRTKKNEAEIMKQLAITSGVPEKNILVETKSRSTYENIVFSRKYLEEKNVRSVLIVTEPYHTPRAELVAQHNLTQTVYVSPVVNSICRKDNFLYWRYYAREAVATLYYFLTRKI